MSIGSLRFALMATAVIAALGSAAIAQERIYIGAVGLESGGGILEIPFGGIDINELDDLQDISPEGAPNNTVRVISPEGDPYRLGPTATIPYNVIRANPTPNGGNYLALPLNGQFNMRLITVSLSNMVDAFGRPVNFVDGQEYEFVYWMRPAQVVDEAGNSWFYDYSPLTYLDLSALNGVGSAPNWSPDEWTEATVRFTYREDLPANTQWVFYSANSSSPLTQFGGTGGQRPFLLLSTQGIGLLDYGPLFRLDTSATTEVYPNTLLEIMHLPSLTQRAGNRQWVRPLIKQEPVYVFCKDPAQNFRCEVTPEQAEVYAGQESTDRGYIEQDSGLWFRTEGIYSHYSPIVGTLQADYKSRLVRAQIGYDHLFYESEEGGKLIGGVSLDYVSARTKVDFVTGQGQIDTEAYGLGTTLTWYGANGFYLDGQAQITSMKSDLFTPGIGTFVEDHRVWGYALSLEAGQKFRWGDNWTITPQAQLQFANVDAEPFTDILGKQITFNAESLQLRLGVEMAHEASWEAADGTTSRRSLQLGAHVIKEFKPETVVDLSGTPLVSRGDDLAGEITLGGTYNWSDDRNSIYGQVAASTGLSNFGDSHRIRGTVGYRRQWE